MPQQCPECAYLVLVHNGQVSPRNNEELLTHY